QLWSGMSPGSACCSCTDVCLNTWPSFSPMSSQHPLASSLVAIWIASMSDTHIALALAHEQQHRDPVRVGQQRDALQERMRICGICLLPCSGRWPC
ncbi:hypothetical protein BC831DRAFT_470004, partial [Entophlyctis helioformis]